MKKIRASIVGASGYTGGEVLRLLLNHPNVEVVQATSESNIGKFVYQVHPNLRKKTMLKFTSINTLVEVDVIFLGLPHKISSSKIDYIMSKTKKIIDKGSDFRLSDLEDYRKWYNFEHPRPELLEKFVYGIPELHREEIKKSDYVAAAGCNATATILGLYPLYKNKLIDTEKTVVDIRAGSSEAGNKGNEGSHHPERNNSMRMFIATGHRHKAEIMQELKCPDIKLSVSSMPLVRGVSMTAHVFLKEKADEKSIWKIYREAYSNEPFIRIVKDLQGVHRYPEVKFLWGSNYCDIGFELDNDGKTLVVFCALDNLMKGAAGQAVQCMNLMFGFDETAGLEFSGLHPV